jgi:hypothetical protein
MVITSQCIPTGHQTRQSRDVSFPAIYTNGYKANQNIATIARARRAMMGFFNEQLDFE